MEKDYENLSRIDIINSIIISRSDYFENETLNKKLMNILIVLNMNYIIIHIII